MSFTSPTAILNRIPNNPYTTSGLLPILAKRLEFYFYALALKKFCILCFFNRSENPLWNGYGRWGVILGVILVIFKNIKIYLKNKIIYPILN
jgi:hypothetical protein